MKDDSVPTEPRESKHSVIQGKYQRVRDAVSRLESLIGELAGKDGVGEAKPESAEPFLAFWESLPEGLSGIENRIKECTEDIRGMIL